MSGMSDMRMPPTDQIATEKPPEGACLQLYQITMFPMYPPSKTPVVEPAGQAQMSSLVGVQAATTSGGMQYPQLASLIGHTTPSPFGPFHPPGGRMFIPFEGCAQNGAATPMRFTNFALLGIGHW